MRQDEGVSGELQLEEHVVEIERPDIEGQLYQECPAVSQRAHVALLNRLERFRSEIKLVPGKHAEIDACLLDPALKLCDVALDRRARRSACPAGIPVRSRGDSGYAFGHEPA